MYTYFRMKNGRFKMSDIKREKVLKDLTLKMQGIFSRNLTAEEKTCINLAFTAGIIFQLQKNIEKMKRDIK